MEVGTCSGTQVSRKLYRCEVLIRAATGVLFFWSARKHEQNDVEQRMFKARPGSVLGGFPRVAKGGTCP